VNYEKVDRPIANGLLAGRGNIRLTSRQASQGRRVWAGSPGFSMPVKVIHIAAFVLGGSLVTSSLLRDLNVGASKGVLLSLRGQIRGVSRGSIVNSQGGAEGGVPVKIVYWLGLTRKNGRN